MRKEDISALYKRRIWRKICVTWIITTTPMVKNPREGLNIRFQIKKLWIGTKQFQNSDLVWRWRLATISLEITNFHLANWHITKLTNWKNCKADFFLLLCRNIRKVVILTLWCICFFFYSVKLLFKSFFP